MSLWRRYIKWIDADLGDGWPSIGGLSSLVFLGPVGIGIASSVFIAPDEKPGLTEALLIIPPTILLFSIWAWRVYLAAMRQVREIRASKDEDR